MTVKEIERIGAPQIDSYAARKAYLEYRDALRRDPVGKQAKDYAALMRGYRAIAKGQQVLDLHKVMGAAGVQEATNLPKLAIGRADWPWVHCHRSSDGRAIFASRETWNHDDRRVGAVRLPLNTLPAGRQSYRGKALTPMIPPSGNPRTGLENYYILWDAVWEPAPPADPLLLKPLGGALYAIVFAWDLTPLEQAVMRGRL